MENVLQGEEHVQKLGDPKEQGLCQVLAGQHSTGMKSEDQAATVLGSKLGSAALLSCVTWGESFTLGDCIFLPIKREDGAHFQGWL